MKVIFNKLNPHIRIAFQLSVPYLSVLFFWVGLNNAWLTILGYHLLILITTTEKIPIDVNQIKSGWNRPIFWFLLPCFAGAGLILYYAIPFMCKVEIGIWLSRFNLDNLAFLLMIPYFGIVHPLVEQFHWTSLTQSKVSQWLIDITFSGYHLIVLWGLLKLPWLIITGIILVIASRTWFLVPKKTGGNIAMNIILHLAADTGIIVAAGLRL